MIEKNKLTAHIFFDEANRFMNNAHKELQMANKNGIQYRDIKHLRVACGTAYLAVLKAMDGIFLLRNIKKPVRRPSIEYYMQGLSIIDKKMVHSLNIVYEIIHRCGYYDGLNDVKIIRSGFDNAQMIINKLKQFI